jgi:hypothetical protein
MVKGYIYGIIVNNKLRYIGSTLHLENRFYEHKRKVETSNYPIYREMKLYGNFFFTILEEIDFINYRQLTRHEAVFQRKHWSSILNQVVAYKDDKPFIKPDKIDNIKCENFIVKNKYISIDRTSMKLIKIEEPKNIILTNLDTDKKIDEESNNESNDDDVIELSSSCSDSDNQSYNYEPIIYELTGNELNQRARNIIKENTFNIELYITQITRMQNDMYKLQKQNDNLNNFISQANFLASL